MRRVLSQGRPFEHESGIRHLRRPTVKWSTRKRTPRLSRSPKRAFTRVRHPSRMACRVPAIAASSSREDLNPIEAWLSGFFDMPVHLRRHSVAASRTIRSRPAPRLSATKPIANSVVVRRPDVDEARIRFRANLLIGDAPAFGRPSLCGRRRNSALPGRRRAVRRHKTHASAAFPHPQHASGEQTLDFANLFANAAKHPSLLGSAGNASIILYRLAVNTRVPGNEIARSCMSGMRST